MDRQRKAGRGFEERGWVGTGKGDEVIDEEGEVKRCTARMDSNGQTDGAKKAWLRRKRDVVDAWYRERGDNLPSVQERDGTTLERREPEKRRQVTTKERQGSTVKEHNEKLNFCAHITSDTHCSRPQNDRADTASVRQSSENPSH